MNIQTERLADHTARFTVEVDVTRFEKAKMQAARKIARGVNIPGFRKGKAPYRILAGYVGEQTIVGEAIEQLGNEIYKSILKESDVQTYGPAEIEDFALEPSPTFTFVVPLQPTIELNDYQSVRLDFAEPEVTDKEVDEAIKNLLERHAVVEESPGPVAIGHRITADVHGVFTDEEQPDTDEATEDSEVERDYEHDDDHEHDDDGIDVRLRETPNYLLHRHDMSIIVEEEREIAPGFSKAMEGAALDELHTFELTYPDDEEEHGELAGRSVRFDVIVKKIENRTLPALNDDFAARVTAEEEEPLTLLQLRIRVRENLESAAQTNARDEYAWLAVDKIAEQATISYPQEMIDDEINRLIDETMERMKMPREDYLRLTQQTEDDLIEQFTERASQSIQRGLVLREVIQQENVEITEEQLEQEISNFVITQFGAERADSFRALFQDTSMRENMRNDLLQGRVLDHIIALAKGESTGLVDDAVDEPEKALVDDDSGEELEDAIIETEVSEITEESADAEPDQEGETE